MKTILEVAAVTVVVIGVFVLPSRWRLPPGGHQPSGIPQQPYCSGPAKKRNDKKRGQPS